MYHINSNLCKVCGQRLISHSAQDHYGPTSLWYTLPGTPGNAGVENCPGCQNTITQELLLPIKTRKQQRVCGACGHEYEAVVEFAEGHDELSMSFYDPKQRTQAVEECLLCRSELKSETTKLLSPIKP